MEFSGLQWIAKLATVSHRHSPPPNESSKREDGNALPFGSLAVPHVYVCFSARMINTSFFNLLKCKVDL